MLTQAGHVETSDVKRATMTFRKDIHTRAYHNLKCFHDNTIRQSHDCGKDVPTAERKGQ